MRIEQLALEQLFEATRAVERAPHAGRMHLRGAVAARLSAAGITLSSTAVASQAMAVGGTSVAHATLLSTVKAKLVLGLIVASSAAIGGAVVLGATPSHSTSHAAFDPSVPASPMTHLPMFSKDRIKVTAPVSTVKGMLGNVNDARSTQTPVKPEPEKDALAQELELVRGAQSEMAAGRPARVLTLLNRYFRRFPSGILRPEAEAARVRALCLAGRSTEAEREADRFTQANPDSPLVARRRTCKTP